VVAVDDRGDLPCLRLLGDVGIAETPGWNSHSDAPSEPPAARTTRRAPTPPPQSGTSSHAFEASSLIRRLSKCTSGLLSAAL
jgi:hypothetical protein